MYVCDVCMYVMYACIISTYTHTHTILMMAILYPDHLPYGLFWGQKFGMNKQAQLYAGFCWTLHPRP